MSIEHNSLQININIYWHFFILPSFQNPQEKKLVTSLKTKSVKGKKRKKNPRNQQSANTIHRGPRNIVPHHKRRLFAIASFAAMAHWNRLIVSTTQFMMEIHQNRCCHRRILISWKSPNHMVILSCSFNTDNSLNCLCFIMYATASTIHTICMQQYLTSHQIIYFFIATDCRNPHMKTNLLAHNLMAESLLLHTYIQRKAKCLLVSTKRLQIK